MTLRRVRASVESRNLGPVKLFREDLEGIAHALKNLGTLSIESEDHEGDAPEDIAKLPEKIKEIKISGKSLNGDCRIDVELGPTVSRIVIVEADILTYGIRAKIQDICKPRKQLRQTLNALTLFASTLSLFLAAFFAGIKNPTSNIEPWLFMAIAYLSTGIKLLSNSAKFKPRIKIINAPKVNRPSFMERTRDDWLVGLTMMIISAIIGGIIGYWVNTIS